MMDWTDRHCRYLLRLIFPEALLYTEMVTTGALLYGDKARFLQYSAEEHPLALQLGGNEPQAMADCAQLAEQWGYDEVNINVGCPSDRVQSGAFGACLMAQPDTVAACVAAMREAVTIPVTVKTRIGIDDCDDYDYLYNFVTTVAQAGCNTFIVHARKAWLQGLSPKENREIPPLQYASVYRLKQELPHLTVVINGGIKTSSQLLSQLDHVDGVMVGREAYQNPFALQDVRSKVFAVEPAALPRRAEIVQTYMQYVQQQLDQGVYLKHMSRHMLGLFQGIPGAARWRRYISEHAYQAGAGVEVLATALAQVTDLNDAA